MSFNPDSDDDSARADLQHPAGAEAGDMSTWRDRLIGDAKTNQVTGRYQNLIRELSRISQNLDPQVPADWMVKRSLFFAYELVARIKGSETDRDRLALLNHFIFEEKKFECITEPSKLREPWEAHTFNTVLAKRAGAAPVLAVIYAFLADRIGVSLEFVDLKPTCFLKWTEQGRSRFIDITRAGATLSSDELIETLHSRFQMTTLGQDGLLETLSFERLLSDYLTALKLAMVPKNEPDKSLFLLNTLITYQPSNLQLHAERALIHRRLGNLKSALADLKRFFAFHEREKAPADLVQLHDDLVILTDRHRTQIEPREEL